MGSNRAAMQRLNRVLDDVVVEGAREYMRLHHRALIEPFGTSPGTPRDTGEAVAAWRVGLNGPPAAPPSRGGYVAAPVSHVDAASAGMRPGDRLVERNSADHTAILDGGRRKSEKTERMLGSEQAPQGFTRQARDTARAGLRTWRYRP